VKRAFLQLFLFVLLVAPALAQAPAQVPAQMAQPARTPMVRDVQSIAAVVNHEVISVYDVLERMKLVILSTDLKDTPETRQRLLPLVLRSLVDEHLQLQEAERLDLKVGDEEIKQAMVNIETDNKIKTGGLDAFLAKAGVDRQTVVDQVRAGLAWGKVIRRMIRPTIDIGDDEVTDALSRLEAAKDKPQDLLAEIFLAVDSPTKDAEVHDTAERLVTEIVAGASFPALARQFSQSASALNGGDIGWVVENQLEPEIEAVIKKMKPPSVSAPIRSPGGYYIMALRERRVIAEEMAASESVRLRQIHFSLPEGATKQDIDAQTRAAQSVAKKARNCDEMAKLAPETVSHLSGDLGWVALKDLPADLRDVVGGLGVNKASKPIPRTDGVVLLMVCERKDPKSLIPTREEIGQILMRQRLELQADRYMRELRSNATVDNRL
jgi:peptidyl-prolyl cis-trans isomerase SurA